MSRLNCSSLQLNFLWYHAYPGLGCGYPVAIILDELSRDSWYIMIASLVFIFPTSLVTSTTLKKVKLDES
jgi:hypothetical protein